LSELAMSASFWHRLRGRFSNQLNGINPTPVNLFAVAYWIAVGVIAVSWLPRLLQSGRDDTPARSSNGTTTPESEHRAARKT
jgi:hypothetical protein